MFVVSPFVLLTPFIVLRMRDHQERNTETIKC